MMMMGTSIISMVSCLPIFGTYLLFPAYRKKASIEIGFYMAVSTFLSCLGSALGELKDRSAACWFQGLTTNLFPLSSVFWSVTVSLVVYKMVKHQEMLQVSSTIHAV